MRARAFLSALLLMASDTWGVSQQSVAVEGGNVVLTSQKRDSEAVMSPDRQWVADLASSGQCAS